MEKKTCPTCGGSGSVNCDKCHGTGLDPDVKHIRNCPKCNGSGGWKTCPKCKGRGEV